ncbi:MAG: hypothetical protein ACTSUE_17410 [Promethearchaeota archaeon]
MISDAKLKLLLVTHVGTLSPPILIHLKKSFMKGDVQPNSLERKVLLNFIEYKKARARLKPSPKEIIAGLYNTLKFTSEYILRLHDEKYDDGTEDLFVKQVERAIVLNVQSPVTDAVHDELGKLHAVRDESLLNGHDPGPPDLILFQNRIKHYLREFRVENLPC